MENLTKIKFTEIKECLKFIELKYNNKNHQLSYLKNSWTVNTPPNKKPKINIKTQICSIDLSGPKSLNKKIGEKIEYHHLKIVNKKQNLFFSKKSNSNEEYPLNIFAKKKL